MNITGRPQEAINLMLEATVFAELSLARIVFINHEESVREAQTTPEQLFFESQEKSLIIPSMMSDLV